MSRKLKEDVKKSKDEVNCRLNLNDRVLGNLVIGVLLIIIWVVVREIF